MSTQLRYPSGVAEDGDTLSEYRRSTLSSAELAPHLQLELECERPLAGPARYRLAGIDTVRIRRAPERSARVDHEAILDIGLPDGWMSSRHAELVRRDGGWILVDLGSKNGSFVNGARIERSPVEGGDLLQLGRAFFRFHAGLPVSGPAFVDARDLRGGPAGITTLSPTFAGVLAGALAVAPSRVPVLLCGESGTGKEVLAQAIHTLSRRSGPFVAVNCGAIPSELVGSQLFGHKKGAFSSAHQDQVGLVRTSDGGTLFLDEIGDLPLAAQAALLRVLQESEVVPVGAARPVKLDLRAIAATHRDLSAMVAQGAFRHDLLARLDGVRLEILPLRERREDVALLVSTLLAKLAPERPDVKLAPDAAQALLEYDWPLNVREVEQALAGALALSGPRPIERAHLPRTLREAPPEAPPRELTAAEQQHRGELIVLLGTHRGNLSAVARAVGKGRTQVLRWIERYGLDADRFRAG